MERKNSLSVTRSVKNSARNTKCQTRLNGKQEKEMSLKSERVESKYHVLGAVNRQINSSPILPRPNKNHNLSRLLMTEILDASQYTFKPKIKASERDFRLLSNRASLVMISKRACNVRQGMINYLKEEYSVNGIDYKNEVKRVATISCFRTNPSWVKNADNDADGNKNISLSHDARIAIRRGEKSVGFKTPASMKNDNLSRKVNGEQVISQKSSLCSTREEVYDTPLFYVSGTNGTRIIENHLMRKGWRRTKTCDSNFKLKWVENKLRIRYNTFREGEQMVNHIPSTWYLSNKIRLVAILRELDSHQRRGLLRLNDVLPETYRLDLLDEQLKFREKYRDGQVWICKPAALNRGKGIYLVRSLEDFELRNQIPSIVNGEIHLPLRIIQRYISEPLLLNGRKADIRSFMLIASTCPFIVLFHPGYVRLSCSKYDLSSNNLRTHLTNQYIQKRDPLYYTMKEDTIWSMDQLNEYMNDKELESRCLQENWVKSILMLRMRRVMLHSFLAVKTRLENKIGYFELLGFDFLVDDDLKVWLIEVNVNPSLCTDCSVLKNLIPSLLRETTDLAIECFEKNRRNLPLLPLQNIKNFALLFCGERSMNWSSMLLRENQGTSLSLS